MITTVAGGEGESYLRWSGFGERFSFSPDGRFFTTLLYDATSEGHDGKAHSIIVTTDGSLAYNIPGNALRPCFSPDGRAVAFSGSDHGASTVSIYDVMTGATNILTRGIALENPTWVDNHTLVYTEKDNGRVYKVDTNSGTNTPMTPPERRFSNYTFPVSREQKKIALTEDGPLYNIWSLDVESGRLTQVTNNTRSHYRAGYLPGSDMIMFQEQQDKDSLFSSELGVVRDDGSDFSLLTSNFTFDGLQTVSLSSGLIAYQHLEDPVPGSAIQVGSADSKDTTLIVEDKTGWVGDPNFVPVPQWTAANPLQMSVDTGAPGATGNPVSIHIFNPGSEPVEATLRAFPGLDLKVSAADFPPTGVVEAGSAPAAGDPGPAAAKSEWRLQLPPGQSRDINLNALVRPTVAPAHEATLLLTLAVTGAPPRMFWTDLG